MADIKSKLNEGQKKTNNVVRRKVVGEKNAVEKEKQTHQQQQQQPNNRQNHKPQANNKNNNKKKQPQQQHQQHQHQQQQQENTKKKVNDFRIKNNGKNAKDKRKEFKNKGNKKPVKQVNVNKPKGSFIKKIFEILLIAAVISMTFLWYLYIVDIEKYRSVRDLAVKAVYSVVQLLPAEVVAKGQDAIEYIRPGVEVVVFKFRELVNHASTVLKTNPVLKDHWSNINEIGAVIGEQIADYMRTVYKQIPIYYDNAKNKLF